MVVAGITIVILALGALVALGAVGTRQRFTWASFTPDLERELERARRYGQSFTILRIELAGTPDAHREVAASLRSTDMAWTADGALYVFVPAQVTDDHLTGLVARLRAAGRVDGTCEARAATFPRDGLTLPALFFHLRVPRSAPGLWRRRTETRQAS